jgi:uncharacterized membrane protein
VRPTLAGSPQERVPRLASDVTRGYAVLAVSLVLTMATSVALVYVPADAVEPRVAAVSTTFTAWSALALLSSIANVAVFWRASPDQLVRWMRATVPRGLRARLLSLLNGGGAVSWAVAGSILAVAAVVFLTTNAELRSEPLVAWTAVSVVVGSLTMIVTSYAVRYARQNATNGGLHFPGSEDPRFSDYLYLAVQIATTFAPSDVQVTTRAMRGIVTVNSIISFAFNTVVIALLVSLLVSSGS